MIFSSCSLSPGQCVCTGTPPDSTVRDKTRTLERTNTQPCLALVLLCFVTLFGALAEGTRAQNPGASRPADNVVRSGSTTRTLNLRQAPGTQSEVLESVPEGTAFLIESSRGEWIQVRLTSGSTGWLYSPYVSMDPPRLGARPSDTSARGYGVTTDSLNLRTGPGTHYPRLTLLPPRRRVEIVERRGSDWLRIESDGLSGWIAAEFVNEDRAATEVTQSAATTPEVSQQSTAVAAPAAVTSATADEADWIGARDQLRAENSRLAREVADSQARTRQVTAEVAAVRAELARSQELQSESNAQLLQAQQQVADLEVKVSALEAQLTVEAQKPRVQLQREFNRSLERVSELEQSLARLNETHEETTRELASALGRTKDAEQAAVAINTVASDQERELQESRGRVAELEAQLLRVAQELGAAEDDVETAGVALRGLRSENDRLRSRAQVEQAAATRSPDPTSLGITDPNVPLAPLSPLSPTAASGDSATLAPEPLAPLELPDTSTGGTPRGDPSRVAGAEPATAPQEIAVPDRDALLTERIEAWRDSWSAQDADGYLDAYSSDFVSSDGQSHLQWRRQRRTRVTAPRFVEIEIGPLSITRPTPDRAMVKFTQEYRSDTFSDTVTKHLTLEFREQRWWIVAESSEPR